MTPKEQLLKEPAIQSLVRAHTHAKEAEQQRAQAILDALVDKHLPSERELRELDKKIADLRYKIHRNRLTIGRKNFSLRERAKAIEAIKASKTKCEADDAKMQQVITDLRTQREALIAKVRERLAGEIRQGLVQEGIHI